jgi:hypothetical protein
MCTLTALVGASEELPLVIAANRDEMLDRPAIPPFVWPGLPRVLSPRDETLGGTWLGLNEHGLFVGVTNRAGLARDPSLRSRGVLVAEALRALSARELHARLEATDPGAYNPFHLLYADRVSAHLTWCDGKALHREDLAPGLHVVTERSFGAGDDLRGAHVHASWAELYGDLSATALGALLARHDEDPFAATCVHADAFRYGTRSSMILFLGATWDATRVLWAEGKPCVTPFVDQAAVVRALGGG